MEQQKKGAKLDPLGDKISSLELVRVSGSDLDVVNAARVSYGKVSEAMNQHDEKLLRYLMEHNHTSPFEHNQLSFRVKAPIYVVREWMRHRMNSYNEISYRFVKPKIEFYIPKTWRHQDTLNKQSSVGTFTDDALHERYKKSIQESYETYESLLKSGICREQARGVLPVCIYTEFIFTCNLHSLMHFLKLRLAPGAQYEIRTYAYSLLCLAEQYFPVCLGLWSKQHMPQVDTEGWKLDFIANLSNTNS